ncbi:hypothetical protein F4804DRAFT_244187 [Jackrogersella minutella]|nr:hypothetical protein F4804DRAFT_244187 [Jackrogersella minutella]
MSSKKAWTQEEKISLLVQALDHIDSPLPYQEIQLPGRSKKSMIHTWSHLRAESAAWLQGQSNGQEASSANSSASRATASSKPASHRSGREVTRKVMHRDTDDDSDAPESPSKKKMRTDPASSSTDETKPEVTNKATSTEGQANSPQRKGVQAPTPKDEDEQSDEA